MEGDQPEGNVATTVPTAGDLATSSDFCSFKIDGGVVDIGVDEIGGNEIGVDGADVVLVVAVVAVVAVLAMVVLMVVVFEGGGLSAV